MRRHEFVCDRCENRIESTLVPKDWRRLILRGKKVGWDLCGSCVNEFLTNFIDFKRMLPEDPNSIK